MKCRDYTWVAAYKASVLSAVLPPGPSLSLFLASSIQYRSLIVFFFVALGHTELFPALCSGVIPWL